MPAASHDAVRSLVLRRKLAVIVENLKTLEPVAAMSPDRYRDELFVRKGTERLLQELIEAASDLNTHILVQDGHGAPDDYDQGFVKLADHGCSREDWPRRWLLRRG